VVLGTRDDDSNYSKASALHLYLLGYEITDSIMIITSNSFWFMASEKKCKYLETSIMNVQSQTITCNILHKTKDEGLNRERFNQLLNNCRKSGLKVGTLSQIESNGPFIQSWTSSLDQSQLEKVDITAGISDLLSIKDETELVCLYIFVYFDIYSLLTLGILSKSCSIIQQSIEARFC
jgi:nucleosome binding factor SPN SPT16 subunit